MTLLIKKLTHLLCKYPKRSIFFVLAPQILLIPLITSVHFSNSYKDFVGSKNTLLDPLYEIEDEFGEYNNTKIMLRPANGVFDPDFLASMIALTDEAWGMDNVKRVDSLTNFQFTSVEGDDLIVNDLIDHSVLTNPQALEAARVVAITAPEIVHYFINSEATAAAVNIDFIMDEGDLVNVLKAWEELSQITDKYKQNYPDVELTITGVLALNIGFVDAIKADFFIVLPLALALIFIGVSILFRNIATGFIALLIATLSTLSGLALVGATGWILVPFTTGGIIIIMILAVADCSHVISAVSQNIQAGMEKQDAIVAGITHNLRGLSLTTLTTAIGFLSFTMSDFAGIVILGCYIAFGICVALLLTLLLLPPLLMLTSIGKNQQFISSRFYSGLARFVLHYRWVILILLGPSVVASGFLSMKNELNDSLTKNMAEDISYNIAATASEQHLSGSSYFLYSISSSSGTDVTDPEFFTQVEAFVNWLKTQPEVRFVQSYTNTLKRLNKDLHNGDPSYYTLPTTREEAAQYLLLYEMSLPYGMDLTNQVNIDKTKVILNVNINDQSIKEYNNLHERITYWLASQAPVLKTETSGTNFMMSKVLSTNFYEMLFGAMIALVAICIILMFTMRSLYAGLICSIGVAAPILACFAAWALTSGVIGLAASYVISMAVGIAVDNSVHFMSQYLHSRKMGQNKPEAITYAFTHVGEAITINTLVLGACFAVLITSSFLLYSVMGLMTVITLGLALLATFLLIPSLLMLGLPAPLIKYQWISEGA